MLGDHRRLAPVPAARTARAQGRPATVPIPQVGVDPRTGRLTGRTPTNGFNGPQSGFVRARSHDPRAPGRRSASFRQLLDEANRANTSFYPIDPRGLAVFDESIGKPVTGVPPAGSTTVTPPSVDAARLRAPHRLAAHARRGDRRPGDRQLQRSRARPQARRRRPELVLPARLLLDRQAGREVSPDLGAREAAGRARPRAPRLSWPRRRRRRRRMARAGGAPRRRSSRRRRWRRMRWRRRSRRCRATRATCRCACRWRPGWKPGDTRLGGDVGGRRAWRRGDGRRQLERRLRCDGDADDAGGRDGRHGADQRAARRPHVPRRGDAVAAAGAGRVRAARRRARRRRRRFRRAKRRG